MSGRTRGLLHWEADDQGPKDEDGFRTPGPIDPMTFESPGYYGNARLVDSSGEIVLDAGGGEYQPYRKPEDAARLALCWNVLCGLDSDAVEKLGAYLEGMNSDQVRDLIADGEA